MNDYSGKRIATAINIALNQVNLHEYDYILRVDADTILPPRFIEKNQKANADYLGGSGYAMLLKVSPFLKVFNGKFAEVGSEDSYVWLKFLHQDCSVKGWVCPPKLIRKSGQHHSYRYYYNRGKEIYKLGYEPIHVFERVIHDFRNTFSILGYFLAIFSRVKRYDIVYWVFRAQIMRLFYGKQT
ncbi:MAG TPA: glycosyltransferase family A protein [Candidatus Glassbacteria bacterium]|nr:glycosyltransferase family A protein [Candidatus Glassbacteria bacterium]